MAALTNDQQIEAVNLYRSGLSMQQVADHFNVSLKAAIYAFDKQNMPRRTSAESNTIRFENKALSYNLKEGFSREEQDLKLAALMLYWAEGYKVGNHGVDFANSDPHMALIFRKFLSEICRVDEGRIRCSIYCYEGQNVNTLT